jgi:hypothetical protein
VLEWAQTNLGEEEHNLLERLLALKPNAFKPKVIN